MSTRTGTAASPVPYPGRAEVWTGVAAALLGPVLYVIQIFGRKALFTPWYVPVLGTAGLVFILLGLIRKRTITRFVHMVWTGLLAGLEWFFLLSFTVLPTYSGPLAVGRPFPAFRTVLADGSTLDPQRLKGDQDTVMVFFRGRW